MRIGKNRVLVKVLKDEELSVKGILLPHAKRREFARGRVEKTGSLFEDECSLIVYQGDVVLFPLHAGIIMDDSKDNHLVLIEGKYIFSVLEEGEK